MSKKNPNFVAKYVYMRYMKSVKSCLTYVLVVLCTMSVLSCQNTFNNVVKTDDYMYKYEAAKALYFAGKYTQCYELLSQMLLVFKNTDKAEECMFMNAMCYYNIRDYETAGTYFEKYYKTYPKGEYTEQARYYSGMSAYYQSPDPRLDQSATYTALKEIQDFIEFYPYSEKREEVTEILYKLQDRLVQKEYDSAQLYFNLGNYIGNCANGGSNFEACIITAENALKTYPYTDLREDLSMMILKARYKLAKNSVELKAEERYRQTVDEYYGFRNEFPESKYMKEADLIFRQSDAKIKKIEVKLNKKEAKLLEG